MTSWKLIWRLVARIGQSKAQFEGQTRSPALPSEGVCWFSFDVIVTQCTCCRIWLNKLVAQTSCCVVFENVWLYDNYIKWFLLITRRHMWCHGSLSEGLLHESVSHKLNSKGKHVPQPSFPRESVDSVLTSLLLSVLVVESDSINLLHKPLVLWSLRKRNFISKYSMYKIWKKSSDFKYLIKFWGMAAFK